MSAFAQEWTCSGGLLMSASANSCHRPTLFDHLVGAGEQRRRHGEAERLGGLQIDRQLKSGRPLDGKLTRLSALEYTINIRGGSDQTERQHHKNKKSNRQS